MLGPGQYGHRQGGLTLVQTRQEPVVNSNAVATPDQVAEEVDDDPCHTSLSLIFNERAVQDSPADVVLKFMTDYCVEEADEFFPSKSTIRASPHFLLD